MAIQYTTDAGVNVHPLDFDAIAKGDTIPPAKLEEITGEKTGTTRYQFAVMQLGAKIMFECGARGNHVTVAQVKGCLCVLSDEHASPYEDGRVKAGLRGAGRHFKRLQHVDRSKLSEQQRKQHDRSVLFNGRMLQAAANERKLLIGAAHKRSTPGLPAPVNGTDQDN